MFRRFEHMRRFTELRVAAGKRVLHWYETGFFAGGAPTVDQLLAEAQQSGCTQIVVQPHLLFEGELVLQLRRKVSELSSDSNRIRC